MKKFINAIRPESLFCNNLLALCIYPFNNVTDVRRTFLLRTIPTEMVNSKRQKQLTHQNNTDNHTNSNNDAITKRL